MLQHAPSLLHIDTAYTLREVRAKRHESFFLARHASGLFRKVWSVHPIADIVGATRGRIDVKRLAPNHVVIEGKVELCRLPRWLIGINLLFSQFVLWRFLVRLVRKQRVCAIVAVDPYLSGLLGLAVARSTRRPFVLRISGNHDDLHEAAAALAMPRLLPSFRVQQAVQRFVFKRADLVTAINHNNLAFGVENGARNHTAIIPISANVADVHRRAPEERPSGKGLLASFGVPASGSILLYVGRLLNLKHPDDALRAMASNIRRHQGTVGVFAGVGSMREELHSLAHDLGVASSIHFLGQLSQDELSLIIPHCILLSPSAGQMALLEGALGGAPIVAYDRDFQPEFIDNGVDGFIVPFRDHHAMAEKVSAIITDPELAQRFSVSVRNKALFHTDASRVKQMEWDAFAKVLGTAMPRRQTGPDD